MENPLVLIAILVLLGELISFIKACMRQFPPRGRDLFETLLTAPLYWPSDLIAVYGWGTHRVLWIVGGAFGGILAAEFLLLPAWFWPWRLLAVLLINIIWFSAVLRFPHPIAEWREKRKGAARWRQTQAAAKRTGRGAR